MITGVTEQDIGMTTERMLQSFSLKYLSMFKTKENLRKPNVSFLCVIFITIQYLANQEILKLKIK